MVGRAEEKAKLARSLEEARASRGSTWLVDGPAGMGKTTLVRWLTDVAEQGGFRAHWGHAYKEVNTLFFPFLQVFRSLERPTSAEDGGAPASPLPSYLAVEEARPDRVYRIAVEAGRGRPTLLVVRERETTLRERLPRLGPGATVRSLSRGEREGSLAPGDLDGLADVVRAHLARAPGSLVVLTGLDYLVSQNTFASVLRLVYFLRDSSEELGGHFVLSLPTSAFDPRQVTVLESDGDVMRGPTEVHQPLLVPQEPPTKTMIRCLDRIEALSAEQPILLVLDDVQWADPYSVRLFQLLARNLRHLPVVLIATLRSDEVRSREEDSGRILTDVLTAMDQEGTLSRLTLTGLGVEEAVELTRTLFGLPLLAGAQDEGLQNLLRRSGGNPFFLRETLRQLDEEGLVRRASRGVEFLPEPLGAEAGGSSAHLPGSLRRLIARRLERLGAPEQELLRWAAVAGSEFDLAPLNAMAAPGDAPPSELLAGLVERERLLVPLGPERWTYAHALIWEVALSETPETERRRRSGQLARWWEDRRPEEVGTVARLFHEAREPDGGLPWVRKALAEAIDERALELAERYYGWLQELLQDGGVAPELRAREGLGVAARLVQEVGVSREAGQMLRSLRGLGADPEVAREVEAYLAFVLATTAPMEAKPLLAHVREEVARSGVPFRPELSSLLDFTEAKVADSEGRDEATVVAAERILSSTAEIPSSTRIAAAYYAGCALAKLGRREEALVQRAKIASWAGPEGPPRFLALGEALMAFVAELGGEVGPERKACEAALAHYRRLGNPVNIAVALYNLGEACGYQGDVGEVAGVLLELRKHCHRFGDRRWAYWEPLLEAALAWMDNRFSEAAAHLGGAVQATLSEGDLEGVSFVRLQRAGTLLASGDLEAARNELGAVRASGTGLMAFLRPLLPLLEGWCDALEGRPERSRQKIEEGLALAQGHAFDLGIAWNSLARWEEAFGDLERGRADRARSQEAFDRSGVLPRGYWREWPPRFEGPTVGRAPQR